MYSKSALNLELLVQRSSFLLPFFIFAALFKKQPFSLERAYVDLTFWLAIVLLILVFLRNRFFLIFRKYSPLYWIFLPLAVFIFITPITSSINKIGTPYFKWKSSYFIIVVIPSVALCYWHIVSIYDWYYFRKGILLLSIYVSIYLFFHPVLSMWGNVNYLMLGTVSGIGGIIVFYEIIVDFGYNRKIATLISLFLIFTYGIFCSYARGEQIAYIVVLIIVLLHNGVFPQIIKRRETQLVIVYFIIFFLFLGFVFFVYQLQPSLFFRFRYISEAIAVRVSLFKKAIYLFRQYPILPLGIGGYHYATYKYPHNIMLELMAEMGIWGGIWYMLVVVLAVSGYLRYRETQIVWEHFYIFLFLILLSWKEGSVFGSKAFWVWTSVGIGLLDRNRQLGVEP